MTQPSAPTRRLAALAALFLATSFAFAQGAAEPVRFDNHKVVRVEMTTTRDAMTMAQLSDDSWTCRYAPGQLGTADFRLSPEAFEALKASGVKYSVLIDDVQATVSAERLRLARPDRGPGWFSDYKDYAAVNAQLDVLVAARPDLATKTTIGTTQQSRTIYGLRIMGPGVLPNTKPAIFVIGCQHAREWITVMSTMYLADQLVNNYATDANIRRMVDNFEIHIVPITNPDGYVYTWSTNRLWRKNRRNNGDGTFGVDLNRNWGFHWGGVGASASTNNDTYRGPSAFSEPESLTTSQFAMTLPKLVLFYDIHSYSQYIIEPWGDTFDLPPDTRSHQQMARDMQVAMAAPYGTPYIGGEGYRIIYATTGTADEWSSGANGTMGLALELRPSSSSPGFVLPPDQIVPTGQEWVAGFRASTEWLLNNAVGVEFLLGKPTRIPSGGSATQRVQFNRGMSKLGNLGTNIPTISARPGRVGPYVTTPLSVAGTDEGGTVFQHTLQGGACGSVTQWYYTVTLSDGSTVTVPPQGALKPFEVVAQTSTAVFADDMEISRGWLVGDPTPGQADTTPTTPAAWIRGDPNGTRSQQEFDMTPLTGVNCFYTGQNTRQDVFGTGRVGRTSGGANQVQKTTLLSPILDLSSVSDAEVSFYLSFANSREFSPDDGFTIDFTNNASAATPTWVNAVTIAPAGPILDTSCRWVKRTLRVAPVVSPTNQFRVRFVAREDGNGDAVEAAVDEFTVRTFTCEKQPCAGDFNGDGAATVQDIFDFLVAWFQGAPLADVNASGDVGVQDIFTFLAAWFVGCA